MKMLIVLLFLLTSCGPISGLMTDTDRAEYESLLLQEANLKAQIETETAPEKRAEMETELSALEVRIAEMEQVAVRNSMGPVWSAITSVPVVGDYVKWVGPLALPLVLPLFGKRSRKHYGHFAKALIPGVKNPDGTRGVQVAEAMLALSRAFGWQHSSPQAQG